MAVYTTPTNEVHHDHFVERDTGSGAGIWAIVAVLIVLFALLFFGSRLFGRGGSSGTNNQTPSNNGSINGSVQTPNGSGSGSINY